MAALPSARALSKNARVRLLRGIVAVLALFVGTVSGFAATATATTLTLSSSAVQAGTAVTLTATVKAGSVSVSPGQVAFCDAAAAYCTDVHRLGTAQLVAGTATLKIVPRPGLHRYKAVFVGTNTYATSPSSSQSLTVSGASTTTSIANVSATSEFSFVSGKGSTPPTGAISFLDTTNANYLLGTATLGGGTSGFALGPSTSCTTGEGPSGVAVGDFNGDGLTDLATANASANTLTICLAHLDGTFTALTQGFSSANSLPFYLTVGDFNNDGHLDLMVLEESQVSNDGNSLLLLAGNGDGTFQATTTSLGVARSGLQPVTGDFDGDGNADLAVAMYNELGGYGVSLFRGRGDGTFQGASAIFDTSSTNFTFSALLAADLNNDGRTDLAFGTADYPSPTLIIELGSSAGTFTEHTQTLVNAPGTSIAGADFNGDGKIDLALIEGDAIVLLNGSGDGTFSAGTSITPSSTPSFLAVGDFNGDGLADVASLLASLPNVAIYLGRGDGTFSTTPTPSSSTGATALAAGDFNGDGFADLAVLPSSGTSLAVLLSDLTSSSTVTGVVVTPVGSGNHQIVASYAGDAEFAASTSGASALAAQQVATALGLTAAPTASLYGQQVTLSVTLNPYTAQGHSTNGETVTFTTHDGTGTLGTGTLSNGVATLSLTDLPAGVSTLAASYGGDTNFVNGVSGTQSYTVAAVTATTLALTSAGVPVTSVASGAVVTLTATVQAGSAVIMPGQVAFCDAAATFCTGSHRLGTAQLTSGGTAVLRLIPTLGSHSYKAVFLGTTANAGSSSGASGVAVTGAYATSSTLQSSGSPGNYTLTAKVTGPGLSTPSGTISLLDTTNANASLGTASLSALSSSLTFPGSQSVATGAYPNAIDTADLNGDGSPDLVVTNSQDNSLTVLLGSTGGTFTTSTVSSNAANPFSNPSFVAVADFNSDGIPDLAVANTGANQVLVLLGRGNGTFSAPLAQSVGSTPYAFAVADFNDDGIPDLAVANTFDNTVTVLLGNGDGSFRAVTPLLTTGSGPTAIVAADFDNDGYQDLAVTNLNDASVIVFYGAGGGSFAASTSTLANVGNSYHLLATDLNQDGYQDLAVANSTGSSVTILLGQGNRSFTLIPTAPSAGASPNWITTADLNADGVADLVTSNRSATGSVSILLGKGDGTYQAALTQAAGSLSNGVVSADWNGDGFPDLAVANSGSNNVSVLLVQPTQTAQAIAGNLSVTGDPSIAHAVEASYPGDGTHAGSTSTSVALSPLPIAATPVFSPAAGAYTAAQTVSLSSLTANATIFYTTDGSTPTSTSSVYAAPLSVTATETIRALASASNYQTSAVASGAYAINYPPTITQQPSSRTINAGTSLTLMVAAGGTGPLTYQWYQGGTLIPAATSATYTTFPLTASASYSVQVNNASNIPATSQPAVITVILPPVIVGQSPNPAINSGQTTTLSVSVMGTNPTYQWYALAGQTTTVIPGEVSVSYTTPPLSAPASYQVQVRDVAGQTSTNFQVSINPVCTLNVQPASTALTVLATARCTDPEGLPVTLSLAWGDNTTPLSSTANSPTSLNGSHTYAASGTYTITLSATDAQHLSSTLTAQVSPNKSPICTLSNIQGQPPTVRNGAPVYPVSAVATCTDPQGQPLTLSLNWGDGTAPGAASNGTITHTYLYPNPANATGIYNVVVTATDSSGLSGSSAPQSFQVVPTTTTLPAGMSSALPSNTMTTAQPSTIPPATQVTFLCTSVSAVFSNGQVNTTLPSTYGISCTSPTVPLTTAPTPVNVVIQTTGGTTAWLRPTQSASPLVVCGIAVPFLGLVSLFPLAPGKRRRQLTSLLVIFVLCFSLSACGGSFKAPPATPTPSALYYVTVLESIVNPPAPTGFIQTSLIVPLNVTP